MGRASTARLAGALLLAILLASMAAPVAQSYARVKLGLLAVDTRNRGLVVNAYVELGPGRGEVKLEPSDQVDESTRYSTRVGFIVAVLAAGRDPLRYGLRVSFETSTPVGGPSASGFLAATIYELARGIVPDTGNITMTGMVSLTGLVLPVAGVEAKLEAAARSGFSEVILPVIEAMAVNTSGEGLPRVVAACDFLDAAAALADAPMPRAGVVSVPAPPKVFREDAERFAEAAARLAPMIDDPKTRELVLQLVNSTGPMIERGDYYSAASFGFVALLTAAEYLANHNNFSAVEEAVGVKLDDAISRAEGDINSRSWRFEGGLCSYWRFAALSEASYRLYLAKQVKTSDPALSLLRALSASSWARASGQVKGPMVDCGRLEDAVRFMADYAWLAYRYLQSVIELPITIRVPVDNRSMTAWLKDMDEALQRGDYALAMGLAAFIVSQVETSLISSTSSRCIVEHWERLAAAAGPEALFPAGLYHRYVSKYAGLLANMTGRPKAVAVASLESTALTWLLPALAIEAAGGAAAPGGAAAGAQAPVMGDYSLLVVAAVSAVAALISAATARVGWPRSRGDVV